MSSNPGLNYIWQDEQRRCQKRGKELICKSSQGRNFPLEGFKNCASNIFKVPGKLNSDTEDFDEREASWTMFALFNQFSEERPAPVNDKERDYFHRLRAFAKTVDSTVACGALTGDLIHNAEGRIIYCGFDSRRNF